MKLVMMIAAFAVVAFARFGLAQDAATEKGPMYHVVALKFKEGTTPEQIKSVEQAFRELKTKIPGVRTLHWGTNVSAEQRNKGFTHCFVLTFTSAADRDAYLVDPAHKAFTALAGPMIDDVFVIDFVGQD